MDYFGYDKLCKILENQRNKIKEDLNQIDFDLNLMTENKDKLLQVLDYSPKMKENELIDLPDIKINKYETKLENNSQNINGSENCISAKEIGKDLINKSIKKNDSNESDNNSDEKINQPKTTSKLSKVKTFKTYLLGTPEFIEVPITAMDSTYTMKEKIIKMILESNIKDLRYLTLKGYKIKPFDDEEGEIDEFALGDDIKVLDVGEEVFAFVEDSDYEPTEEELEQAKTVKNQKELDKEKSNENQAKLEKEKFREKKSKTKIFREIENKSLQVINEKEEDEEKIKINKYEIKVHYKLNGNNFNKNIELSGQSTIESILLYLFKYDLLINKNTDLYFIVPHDENDEEPDIDNIIPLETDLSNWSYLYDFDIYYKKDAPLGKISYDSNDLDNNIERLDSINNNILIDNENENENEKEYVFNDISAGVYQEFEVIKINKSKNEQERILGIDMYKLYNNKPKGKNSSFLDNLFKKTKTPVRKIKDVISCEITGDKSFYIELQENDKNETTSKIFYKVKTNDIRNEIVAKINYLIKLNQDNIES